MAQQNTESDMSALQAEKEQISSYFDQLNKDLPLIHKKLAEANERNDSKSAGEITNSLLEIQAVSEELGNRYAEIKFQLEDKEGLKQISEASTRLRTGQTKEEFKTGPAKITQAGPVAFYTPPSYNQALSEKQKKEDLSLVSGVQAETIDPNAYNAPPSERFWFGALKSDEEKAKYLEKRYGEGNVLPITLGGGNEFLVKKSDGTAFTTENKGAAGNISVVATEAPIVAGEIASFSATLGATKSPALAYVASGATRTALGTIIDSAVQGIAGIDPQYFKAFTNRGTEAIIGVATGPLFDKAGSMFLGQRIGPNFANEFANTLDESATRLMRREASLASKEGRATGNISIPFGARIGGEAGLESQQALAGSGRKSISTPMQQTQDTIRNLWNSFVKGVPIKPTVYREAAKQKLDNVMALSEEVAKRSNLSVSVVSNSIKSRQSALSQFLSNEDELGTILGKSLRESESAAIDLKNNAYNEVFDLADSVGATYDPKDLYNFAFEKRLELQKGLPTNAVKAQENALYRRAYSEELLKEAEKKASKFTKKGEEIPHDLAREIDELNSLIGPMDAREFDRWIRNFNEARVDNLVGATAKDELASRVAMQMSNLRRDFYSSQKVTLPDGTATDLGSLYSNATIKLNERMKFEGNLLGRVLKEEVGENKMFPREIVSAVMAEPSKINNALNAVAMYEAQDPARVGMSAQIRELMKSQYLYDLGFGKPGVKINSVKYDRGMVNAIWGKDAPVILKSMDELNGVMEKAKLGNYLTFNDIKLLEGQLDETSRRKAIKQIYLRMVAERDLEKSKNSVIYKLASKGNFEKIDPDMLSKWVVSDGTTVSEAKTVMEQLSKSSIDERNQFKGDFIRELMNSFPGGRSPHGEPFTPMFDTEAFVKSMESPIGGGSSLRNKVETVLGKEGASFLYDVAKVNNANRIKYANDSDPIRMTGNMSGISFYLAHGVTKSVRNRLTAAMLAGASKSTPVRNNLLKAMGSRVSSNAEADLAQRQLMKNLFATRTGITELARQARDDEEFSTYLSDMAQKFQKEDRMFQEMLPEK